MKKIYSSLLFALVLSLLATTAFAYDAEIDGIYYNFSGTKASVTYLEYENNGEYFSDYKGEINIPEFVEYNSLTYVVTSIDRGAFYDCHGLTSITIPNSVISIGRKAFSGCNKLTSITIPNSVTSIGKEAFWDCSGLTSLTIPNSVTTIGEWAFIHCSGLTSVTISNSVTKIADSVFQGCSKLTSVTIPNSVTSIEESAFEDCTSLTSVSIGNSVTTIGSRAFLGCSSLTSITIPNSVTSIGSQAFYGCSSLISVTVDIETPLTITSSTFSNRANATLYVPCGSKAAYEQADYWKEFKEIIELDPKICATPVLTYQNGKIRCSCDTEGVKYMYSVTSASTSSGESSDGIIELGTVFTVSVYATRDGYENSEPATITIDLASVGDMNGDGIISIADVTGLVNVILGK